VTAAALAPEKIPEPFIKTPLGIALLSLSAALAGFMINERVSTETHSSTADVRIEAMDKRMNDYQAIAVSRQQFDQAQVDMTKRLDDIRQDLRDLKSSVDRASHASR
jgi:predicted component of type VI protein secretion system